MVRTKGKQFFLEAGIIDVNGDLVKGVNPSKGVREGEILIEGVGGVADVEVRRVLNFFPTRGSRGELDYVSVTLLKKDGTAPTNIEIEIFSTNDLTVTRGQDTNLHIFRDPTNAVPTDAVPAKLITDPIDPPFQFIIKGAAGKMSIAIKHTGGGVSTDFDYLIEVDGHQLEV